MIITIDGPAGAGKSTVAKLLAEKLNISYLDSGAIYRTLTLACLKSGVDVYDEDKILSLLSNIKMEFREEIREGKRYFACYLNGEDVTEEIRTKEVSELVSVVSKYERVRKEMLEYQRAFAIGRNIVCDGRDMGSFVFAEADFKFFLTADPKIRAKRRYEELKLKGVEVSFDEVLANIFFRDDTDSKRKASPLVPAPDAVIIDTSNLQPEEVVEKILEFISKRQGRRE